MKKVIFAMCLILILPSIASAMGENLDPEDMNINNFSYEEKWEIKGDFTEVGTLETFPEGKEQEVLPPVNSEIYY